MNEGGSTGFASDGARSSDVGPVVSYIGVISACMWCFGSRGGRLSVRGCSILPVGDCSLGHLHGGGAFQSTGGVHRASLEASASGFD